MPASMINAPVGSMPNVIGNSMVMVAMGPTPGSTPIRVPTRQPRKHSNRFLKDSATAIPSARLLKRSTIAHAHPKSVGPRHEPSRGRLQRLVRSMQGPENADDIKGDRQTEQFLEQKATYQRCHNR